MTAQIEFFKKSFRAKLRNLRDSVSQQQKQQYDDGIFRTLIDSNEFKECDTLLAYVSCGSEADTHRIIKYSLSIGKTVAVPKCADDRREIAFYFIDSFEDLRHGAYGILEPVPTHNLVQGDSRGGLCLVPGLCFDIYGNRFGYGGGYYDRFLSSFDGLTAGLCYSFQLQSEKLPVDSFDAPVQMVVTERNVIRNGNYPVAVI